MEKADSPESSILSMKNDRSKDNPPALRDGSFPKDQSVLMKRADSPAPSSISMKSDRSKDKPPQFREGSFQTDQSVLMKRADSPAPSSISMKSDRSKGEPPHFREGSFPMDQSVLMKRADSPAPSSISMKSDRSKGEPPHFREGSFPTDQSVLMKRADSPAPSSISMKSDRSKGEPPHFREGSFPTDQSVLMKRADSPAPSSISMKSDRSKGEPPHFREGSFPTDQSVLMKRADSPAPSSISMKSDRSKGEPPHFREGSFPTDQSVLVKRADSPAPSSISMKSDRSKDEPPLFREGSFPTDQSLIHRDPMEQCSSDLHDKLSLSSTLKLLEENAIKFLKNELKKITKYLEESYAESSEPQLDEDNDLDSDDQMQKTCGKAGALKVILYILWTMKQNDLADRLEKRDLLLQCQYRIKCNLKKKFEFLFEGKAKEGQPTLLNEIYTELYINEGGTGGVNDEHEVRLIETASKKSVTEDITIKCNDIFKPLCEQETPIRTVLTKGVAGIGKTVSVQKFILDWADGKANHDICLIFALPFRDLNLIKDEYSLIELLRHFVPELKSLDSAELCSCKILIIFDGLDECRLPLDFQKNESWFDVTKETSLDVLLTNLIKGNLLPSARLWITSRPAAANQIPPECIHQVTEIRGFNDPQKEEYFRKKFSDQSLASKIITHVKSSKSLFIMCHIPVFCWISATVLEILFSATDNREIPRTLTEMYTHFLIFQTNLKNDRYMKHQENERTITKYIQLFKDVLLNSVGWFFSSLKNAVSYLTGRRVFGQHNEYIESSSKFLHYLGKLAYYNFEKGNLIFYEQDLKENDIDVSEASVYSGVCTEIFKEEFGLYREKVYCFVHLSIQEYLAALYVFQSNSPADLLKTTVDQALESKNGHLDLYLRFLLGLSVDSNKTLLQRLLGQTRTNSHNITETARYIKDKIKQNLSPERTINLFHCLNELNDNSLVEEVQSYLNSGSLSREGLSPAQWSALAFVLLMSDEELDVFDLKKYIRSNEGLQRLLPVVKKSRTALLNNCNLTETCCEALAIILTSNSSYLRELDLSDNDLQDSGVKQLSAGLGNEHCKVEILRLNNCNLTETCCEELLAALTSNCSCLRELDLSNNDLQDSGVNRLSAGLGNERCKVEILRLNSCNLTETCCEALALTLRSNSSYLRELDLSDNDLQDSGVKLLFVELENPDCTLEILRLSDCRVREEGCSSLTSALRSNPSHLRELDLSYNHPGDSGVKQLSALLEGPSCKLEKLKLNSCKLSWESCIALASALSSNPHVKELDLSDNELPDLTEKQHPKIKREIPQSALLGFTRCKLEILRLNSCNLTETCCEALALTLRSNSSHLRELDLSDNDLQDSGMKLLFAELENPHCTLEILRLNSCNLTVTCCEALALTLRSNSSSLRELHLSDNDLQDSGVKLLFAELENPHCTLEILRLAGCMFTEEGCSSLTSALRSNPSHLRELDLSYNHPGDSGVKLLSAVLEDPSCKLEILKLNSCKLSWESCIALASALSSNPHVRELDLSDNELPDLTEKQHPKIKREIPQSALLGFTRCKLEILRLNSCNLTETCCEALALTLRSNSSYLRELDLSDNDLQDSGMKLLFAELENPHCTLEILRLAGCTFTEEGCSSLTSALRSNPSHLRELDLSYNHPGDSVVKLLSAVLEDPSCKLEILKLNSCKLSWESCIALASALSSNPHVRELDLSDNELPDLTEKQHPKIKWEIPQSALLGFARCKLKILRLNSCSLTDTCCEALALTLRSNSSYLRELDLSDNDLQDSGMKLLFAELENPHCTLEILRLAGCTFTEEGCSSLTSALRSNPSHLRELDLSYNHPGDSGVKLLSAVLEDPSCKLEILKLNSCKLSWESCIALASALSSNPHVRELDLSDNELPDLTEKQHPKIKREIPQSALLGFTRCKLKILRLNSCNLTYTCYEALALTLRSNSLFLRELDLSDNDLQDSGMKLPFAELENPHCSLEILRLAGCTLTEEGCSSLTSALRSNPSHLRELDLSYNHPGDSGVKLLSAVLEDPSCKLEILKLNSCNLSWESCIALASALSSNPHVRELDLSDNELPDLTEKQHPKIKREIPQSALLGFTRCKMEILRLNSCNLTETCCEALALTLRSNFSFLRELDLSDNDLQDSGMKLLFAELENPHCTLEILRLAGCTFTEEGCSSLTSALRSNPSHLRELDLSYNHPGDSGVKLLSAVLEDPSCKLEILKLNSCKLSWESCIALASALSSNPHVRELDLSDNELPDLTEKQHPEIKREVPQSALLGFTRCKLEILRLNSCNLTETCCEALALTLRSNSSYLRELDLSDNDLQDSGMKLLFAELENPHCTLEILRLAGCTFTEEGCSSLTSALRSNPSHLRELDLSYNHPGDSGVKLLSAVLEDPSCKLEILKLNSCKLSWESCIALASALSSNPHVRELDLSDNELPDLTEKQHPKIKREIPQSALLGFTRCKLKILRLNSCNLTKTCCEALALTLRSNSSYLRELDLSDNDLQDSGMKLLFAELENPHCTLEILRLVGCTFTAEGCSSLTSALRSNPSHLRELDLSYNHPGDSGVKLLSAVLEDPSCKLEILKLNSCKLSWESCIALASALSSNPHMRELDLSDNELPGLTEKQHPEIKREIPQSALLGFTRCKLEILRLNSCNLTKTCCEALALTLRSNSSYLRELDLSDNDLQDSGMKLLFAELENPHCTLEILRLAGCTFTEEGCSSLTSALKSNPSHLRELDLSYNHPGDSGVKLLSAVLEDPSCKLEILKLNSCKLSWESCIAVASALSSNPHVRELDLSDNELPDLTEKQHPEIKREVPQSALLGFTRCKMEILRLNSCSLTETCCEALALTLRSNSSYLRELDLSDNDLQDSGMKLLFAELENPHCTLEILRLAGCMFTEEGCSSLTSALRSNPSHLRELDLSYNHPGDSGVKLLSAVLENPSCELEILKLNNCKLSWESCIALASAVSSNPHVRELDLSDNELPDLTEKQHPKIKREIPQSALLGFTRCKLKILRLNSCNLTETYYEALALTLRSNSSYLRELDLSDNDLQDSGMKLLFAELENPHCTLEILRLAGCTFTEEGCSSLTSALRSIPSHLRELDLSYNRPGDSEVKLLSAVLEDPSCKLEILKLNSCKLSWESCIALASALSSNPHVKELDLSENELPDLTEKQHPKIKREIPQSALLGFTRCKMEILRLNSCNITEPCCEALALTLRSNSSYLRELDLSDNDLQDSGVKLLFAELENPHCTLEILRLAGCTLTEEGCSSLTSALRSNPSHLRELDLSYNHPGDSGVKLLSAVLENPSCKLEILKLNSCKLSWESCIALASALSSNPHVRELDLSDNELPDLTEKQHPKIKREIPHSALLGFTRCKLETLRLNSCNLTETCCEALALTLRSNSSYLRELDLSDNDLQDSGMKLLFAELENPHCTLEILRLAGCTFTEEGCSSLTSALRSNPSHLRELDLSYNHPGDSGVKLLSAVLENPSCKLEILKLNSCKLIWESCIALASALSSNPHVRELDLSDNELPDLTEKQHPKIKREIPQSALLGFTRCKLEILRLNSCSLTETCCEALALTLRSNSSYLRELDLSDNDLQDSGMKLLFAELANPHCTLEILRLAGCTFTEEGCSSLTSALRSNPSHLRELDLSYNHPGDSGVKLLSAVLENPSCKLEILKLNSCKLIWESCIALASALSSNPHVRELDLSDNELPDLTEKQHPKIKREIPQSALLGFTRCKMEILRLNSCNLTETCCEALALTLRSNSSYLRELDLSDNDLQDSGMKLLFAELANPHCTLEILRLAGCTFTEEGCSSLTSALRSNPSHLRELDLSYNHPGDSGVKLLSAVLENPSCELEILKLNSCKLSWESCIALASALSSNPHVRELDLSDNELPDLTEKQHPKIKREIPQSALLGLSRCKLEILRLNSCNLTETCCEALALTLRSNSSYLRELDLSDNDLQDSGMKLLFAELENPHCTLEILRLAGCTFTEEGCSSLNSALRSNPSHLRELNLSYNHPGDSGVKLLSAVLEDPSCKLEILKLNSCKLSWESCIALASALSSNPHVRELDLSDNELPDLTEKQHPNIKREIPQSALLGFTRCKMQILRLNSCSLTETCCEALALTLRSNSSYLRELDLSDNDLQDSGMKLLFAELANPHCTLEILRLAGCTFTEEGCSSLTSALRLNPSHLRELDLSYNHPGDSGVKLLSAVLENPSCKLEILKLNSCKLSWESCIALASALSSNPHVRELDLIDNELLDLTEKQHPKIKREIPQSALLGFSRCKLEILRLNSCNLTETCCEALALTLRSNSSYLRELDLSDNDLQDSGMKLLFAELENPHCTLEILRLAGCTFTEEGCSSLTSALRSNPSHLRELDLSYSHPGDSGVKLLSAVLEDPSCKLEILKLNSCKLIWESCIALASALSSNPHVRELDLSDNELPDLTEKQHPKIKREIPQSALLGFTRCKLEILRLNSCSLTETCCEALALTLRSNSSYLRELDLSDNDLQDSGMKLLFAELANPHCTLEILRLAGCTFTEEGCSSLTSALRSNPSHLRELDLSYNHPGDSGVKLLSAVLENPSCKLEILKLNSCKLSWESCIALASALSSNPHVRELDLIDNELLDLTEKQHPKIKREIPQSALLGFSRCKLEILRLNSCNLTETCCEALALTLRSNSSYLRELDLSDNDLQDSGMKLLFAELANPHCTLEILRLAGCTFTEEGCSSLTSALRSNPSHLRELDLSYNHPGDSGVKLLSAVLENPSCELEILKLNSCKLSWESCIALASALSSNPHVRELDLSDNELPDLTEKQHPKIKREIPQSALLGLSRCKLEILRLNSCNLTETCCEALALTLRSNSSYLRELDLSDNDLQDSGMKLLFAELANPHCTLEILRLAGCTFTEEGCSSLTSALRSNPSHLRELDLSYNHPGDSGVKLLSAVLENPSCELEILKLNSCKLSWESCIALASALSSNPHVRELDLIDNELLDLTEKQHPKIKMEIPQSALLGFSRCKLEILRLNSCNLTETCCEALALTLRSNSSYLRELDLSDNDLQDSGVKLLFAELENPHCTLEILRLAGCTFAEEGCSSLTSALRSNPSHLRELDLSYSHPGDSGVKLLSAVLEDPSCKLEILKLNSCKLSWESCIALASALSSNPHVRELDLSDNELPDLTEKQHPNIKREIPQSALLGFTRCKLEILRLNSCSLTETCCEALALTLRSNSSYLRELDLSDNDLQDSGMKLLFAELANPHCTLEILRLAGCTFAEEGCSSLTSALRSNPSHLRELDLSYNHPGDSGVKLLSAVLENPSCKLEILKLNSCKLIWESCIALASALSSNPHVRELDLSDNELPDLTEKQHPKIKREIPQSALLGFTRCKMEILRLNSCNLTETCCEALALTLRSNSSYLRELDLSDNDLQDSGMKLLFAELENPHCTLEILRLAGCTFTEEGCSSLTSALRSNPSHLRELDLSYNHPGDSGVKLLSAVLENPSCELEILKLNSCKLSWESCIALASALSSNPHVRELDLIDNELLDLTEKQHPKIKREIPQSALLGFSRCKLEILRLNSCNLTETCCEALAFTLRSNSSYLRELDLSDNDLQDSGVKLLFAELENPHCTLEILRLAGCTFAEEGCSSLTSALMSNPSHLRELDLSYSHPGDSGVKLLSAVLEDPSCKLEILKLNSCKLSWESCIALASALSSNPHVRELDLSDNELPDLTEKQHPKIKREIPQSALLGFTRCKLEILRLNSCSLTETCCEALALTLRSNSSYLRELDLSDNDLQDSGMKLLFAELANPHCTLEILRLAGCTFTEEGCSSLTSALMSNPSHLRELDLSYNHPGDSGVKLLSAVLENPSCKLEILKLNSCKLIWESCIALASALSSNPHVRELDLSDNELPDLTEKQHPKIKREIPQSALLGFTRCKMEILRLNSCNLTETCCEALALTLRSNSSYLRELDLSDNDLQDSGMKLLFAELANPHCTLEILRLAGCTFTEEGCSSLTSALRSNPSHLRELDLSYNHPGDSGVKLLSAVLEDPSCKLEILKLNSCKLSWESCIALASALSSNPHVRELDLIDNELLDLTEKQHPKIKREIPQSALLGFSRCKLEILRLNSCNLTETCCEALALTLRSNSSYLRELDLSDNDLQDSGVKLLFAELENPHCTLEILRLAGCTFTEEGCSSLTSALRSIPSHLRELDLSYNHPGDSGVKLLSAVLEDPCCKLEILKLNSCKLSWESCIALASALSSNPHVRELDLSDNELPDLTEKQHPKIKREIPQSALLGFTRCKLEILRLNSCNLTETCCEALALTLRSNYSFLRELELSDNDLQDSGMKLLFAELENPHCTLEILRLAGCTFTEEGCSSLTSALGSNPSHLRELDLSYNHPGDSGVKLLSALLEDPSCKLEILKLNSCNLSWDSCIALASALSSNPHVRELDLSDNELPDLTEKQHPKIKREIPQSALLGFTRCKLKILRLNSCNITEPCCEALALTLRSNSSYLRELDLSDNDLQDSGVKLLFAELENPHCSLEILRLAGCTFTEEGCSSLTSALRSNPSHLRELDLSYNHPGDSGVKLLSAVLEDPSCKLEILKLNSCKLSWESCIALASALSSNPHVRELDLSDNELPSLIEKQHPKIKREIPHSALLGFKRCKLEILRLNSCNLTETCCEALALTLRSNSSYLRELDLSDNDLQDSGVKLLFAELENPHCTLEIFRLAGCTFTEEGCSSLTSALRSNPSHLRELDLSYNHPGDSGVKLLSAVLEDPSCKLEILKLNSCNLTETCCEALALTLRSNSSYLRELDLSDNNLQDSGLRLLTTELKNPHCKLEILRLADCRVTEEGCSSLTSALRSNPSHLRELDLSYNHPGNSGVKLLSAVLEDPSCKLEILKLKRCNLIWKDCLALDSAVRSDSHLRELDLSDNMLDSTSAWFPQRFVHSKFTAVFTREPTFLGFAHCKLQLLRFNSCKLTKTCCEALALTLRSNSSHLRELDLSGNDLQDSGVKLLFPGLENPYCTLEILRSVLYDRLNNCKLTKTCCEALALTLRSKSSHLRELDLSDNDLKDAGVKLLFPELEESCCKLEILRLSDCGVKKEGCFSLISALRSNPSHLRELDLSYNHPGNSGVKLLSAVLENPSCKLEILRLSGCGVKEQGCSSLTSALRSNPSYLRELDLSDNKLKDSEVKQLSDLLVDPSCKLEKMTLLSAATGRQRSKHD
ncbi:uncharacterized protein LOC125723773 [Brienomyrus brachyistius]|uniref:uncharacterized protein LOC125723773 n=1 Tax=Brienomyrus brachyistius TaxID=42636 RepID=UPI0020B42DB9|nr:uncharacterized protein LOC125723773 [Brienomyrus brachyistius]